MTRYLHIVAFVLGLAVAGWIAAGYVNSNILALAVTILIGAFYVAGAWELRRYHQATSALAGAVAGLSEAPPSLGAWLEQVPAGLRNAVRLRVEGDRVGLPGPALTPYIVGLLVLLGMLGTFLGMVATLRGTGLALESATDVAAIRASLAAPVQGLGFAFGTSVAGVATSAMLGLMSALCRRERILAAQGLDTRIGTVLRVYSLPHQREESFKLLQRQTDVMPVLVDRLQAMMTTLEQQSQALGERLAANQEAFHGKTEAAYTRLASSVDLALKESVAESARVAGAAIRPAVEATMAGIARETTALHETVSQAVQRQLDGLSARFETTTGAMAQTWSEALAEQKQVNGALTADLRTSLDRYAQTWNEALAEHQQASGMLAADLRASFDHYGQAWHDALADHRHMQGAQAETLRGSLDGYARAWNAALAEHRQMQGAQAEELRGSLDGYAQAWNAALAEHRRMQGEQAEALRGSLDGYAQAWTTALAEHRQMQAGQAGEVRNSLAGYGQAWSAALAEHRLAQGALATELRASFEDYAGRWNEALAAHRQAADVLAADLRAALDGYAQAFDARAAGLVDGIATRLETATGGVAEAWGRALAQHEQIAGRVAEDTRQAMQAAAAVFEQHATGMQDKLVQVHEDLQRTVGQSHSALQDELVARDRERLDAWAGALDTMAASWRQEWEAANAGVAAQQREICQTLARTADEIAAQAEAHANGTIAEISRLVQAASEAPRAAAGVVAELRQKLSDSMARDNAMLEERARILDTLNTLLQAVNHASSQQREAVDALVSGSADLLERVGDGFTRKVEAETGKLADVAAQVTGGAVEVASLGEAFGLAMQGFSQSNDKLAEQLQRIESALGKSMARSDEQLAYYVAQAKEVIDLSMMSQRQIVEDLQQLAAQRASAAVGSEAA